MLDRPLEELLSEARRLRESTAVTYSPKVFIPLTKLCRDVCHYCTFAGPPRRGERAYLAPDEVLALPPWISNIQASWVKLGPGGAAAALRAGCNDMGGTLMNESISRAAGTSHGQEMPPEQMEQTIRGAGRVPRQRTTLYGTPPAERVAASFGAPPLAEPLNPPVDTALLRRPEKLIRPGLALA